MRTWTAGTLIAALAAIGHQAPTSVSPDASCAWPALITWDRLEPALLPWDGWISPAGFDRQRIWRTHHAWVAGPTGHGLGTVVMEMRGGGFFVRSDCGQGHYDFPIGPFVGDPCVVLDAELPCLTEDLDCSSAR